MTTCVLQSESTCVARVNQAKAYVQNTLPGQLDSVYSAITARAPAAHVVVLGYPRFYQLNGSCIAGLTETERAAINGAADLINSTTAKRAADHGFTFGNVTSTFTGHEICSGSAWLHSVNWLDPGESYHPTAASTSPAATCPCSARPPSTSSTAPHVRSPSTTMTAKGRSRP